MSRWTAVSRLVPLVAVAVPLAWSAAAFAGTGGDNTEPTYTLVFPARGQFVSGAAQIVLEGTASDSGSGIATVVVNGQQATLNGNTWRAPVSLGFGVNVFDLQVSDNAGNVARTSWAAMYSETYRPANSHVENGAALRIAEKALSHLTERVANHLHLAGIKFARPAVLGHLRSQGLELVLTTGHLSGLDFSAKSLSARATVEVGAANGKFIAEARQVMASLEGFRSAIPRDTIESAIAQAIQTELPPAIETALNELSQPRTFGADVVVATKPRAVAIDPRDLRLYLDAIVISPEPVPGPSPGSVSRLGTRSAPPPFQTPHDFSLSLREDFLNHTLLAAWQSQPKVVVDQAFLAELGITLPFPLDATFLIPFFPALEPLTGGRAMPVRLELNAVLPPVAEVTGAPNLFGVAQGELHLMIQMDVGQSFIDVLGLVIHTELEATAKLTPHDLRIIPGTPTRFVASLLSNPLGLSQADIDQFLESGIPVAFGAALAFIPSIPIPPLPTGIKLKNFEIARDGEAADFVTISGDEK